MGSLVNAVREEKGMEDTQIGKEDIKLNLFTDDRIICVEYPRAQTKKLLELIRDDSKVAEYKVNTQNSIAFLYTNKEQEKYEIKNTIQFTLASPQNEIT